jgi:hypothetical protein
VRAEVLRQHFLHAIVLDDQDTTIHDHGVHRSIGSCDIAQATAFHDAPGDLGTRQTTGQTYETIWFEVS